MTRDRRLKPLVETRAAGLDGEATKAPVPPSGNRPTYPRKSLNWKQIERPTPIPGSVTFDRNGRLIDAYSGKPVEMVA